MASRLFKHQLSMNTRPPAYPHLADTRGDIWQYNTITDAVTKIFALNVGTRNNLECSYSPDGKFYVMVSGADGSVPPTYSVYKRTSAGYSAVTLPGASLSNLRNITWSADSKLLIFSDAGGGIYRFRRNADDTFTRIAGTVSTGVSSTFAISLTPDGKYLACGVQFAPFLVTFRINADDTMTKLASPAIQPSSYPNTSIRWINNTTLLYASSGSYQSLVYSLDRNADTMTKVAVTGLATTYAYGLAVSPDGKMAVIGTLYGYDLYQMDLSTNTFTRLVNNTTYGRMTGGQFSADGKYLAMTAVNVVSLFKVVGSTLVAITVPPAATTPGITSVCLGPAVY